MTQDTATKRTARKGRKITRTTTTTTTTTTQRKAAGTKTSKNRAGSRPAANKPTAKKPATKPSTPRAEQPRYSSVKLRVHEIECVKPTGELGRDELKLAAVKVEGALGGTKEKKKLAARAQKGEQVSAGKFRKGDKQKYPKTRVLATYDAGGPIGSEPRFFLGAVLLVETDEDRMGAVINSTVKSVEKEVVAAISTATATASAAALTGVASGAALGSAVPLVGTAIGAAAGAAVGLALGEIKDAKADDVFPLKKVDLELSKFPAEPGEIPGSRQTLNFKGFKGHYKVTISWAVR